MISGFPGNFANANYGMPSWAFPTPNMGLNGMAGMQCGQGFDSAGISPMGFMQMEQMFQLLTGVMMGMAMSGACGVGLPGFGCGCGSAGMGMMGMGAGMGQMAMMQMSMMAAQQMMNGGMPGGFPGANYYSGGMPSYGASPPANPNQQVSGPPNPNLAQMGSILDQASAKYGIPPNVLKAVAWNESKWNPNSVGDYGQSHGAMQIYSGAHPDYNVAEGRANPAYNVDYAAKMLKNLYGQYGNWQLAAQHYNGSGPSAVAYGQRVVSYAQTQPWGQA